MEDLDVVGRRGDNGQVVVEAAQVESVTINNVQDIPIWVWIALVVGWVLPSPQEIARGFVNLFRRKR